SPQARPLGWRQQPATRVGAWACRGQAPPRPSWQSLNLRRTIQRCTAAKPLAPPVAGRYDNAVHSRPGSLMPTNGAAAQKATERAASEQGLYRIGEVSRLTDLKAFVLRYWETEFPMLEPVKSSSGHRLYRQEDVDLVLKIKRLLYDEGFTIAGARRHLREGHADGEGSSAGRGGPSHEGAHTENIPQLLNRKMLLDLRDSLRAFLTLLEKRQ